MESDNILVIGAGPAGLVRHYDRLHLHTTKTHSGLPMMPWPKRTPRYPAREQLVQYLQAYAAEHDVVPRLGVTVHAVRRTGNHFDVETSAGVMTLRIVVMATGSNRVPKLPSLPGLNRFNGSAIHASEYQNAGPYRAKRTLVVGCGNSGAEIALDLAEQGVDVALVVRGPVHVVPREMFGRPIQHTNILLSHLPLGLRDAIAIRTLRLVVGDLGRIPILDIGAIAMVKRGRIRDFPGCTSSVSGILPLARCVRSRGKRRGWPGPYA